MEIIRIIINSENYSNQAKFENVLTKFNHNIQNGQMQFLILKIPKNLSQSKMVEFIIHSLYKPNFSRLRQHTFELHMRLERWQYRLFLLQHRYR